MEEEALSEELGAWSEELRLFVFGLLVCPRPASAGLTPSPPATAGSGSWSFSLSSHGEVKRQRRLPKPRALQRLQRLNKMQMHHPILTLFTRGVITPHQPDILHPPQPTSQPRTTYRLIAISRYVICSHRSSQATKTGRSRTYPSRETQTH